MNQYQSEERKILYDEFNKITGWHFNDYPFGFDVIALDDLLQKNYERRYDCKKSCKNNLEIMYGKRCREIVEKLLK